MKPSFCLLFALLIVSCASSHEEFVNEEEAQFDDVTLDVLKYGVGYIWDRAAERFGVSTDNVVITGINSVETEDLSDDTTNYICDVDATNNDDARVEATFTIEYNHVTEEKIMRRWRYHITYRTNNNEEDEFEGFLSEEEDDSWESAIVESAIEEENVLVEVEVEVEVQPVAESEVVVVDDTDFEDVSDDEIQNNPVIDDVLKSGAAFIFDRAADRFGVSNSSVDITDIESVERREEGDNKTLYRCQIDATNNDDATVGATFTVEYDNETQEKTVREWRYSIRYQRNDDEEAVVNEEADFEFAFDESQDDSSNIN